MRLKRVAGLKDRSKPGLVHTMREDETGIGMCGITLGAHPEYYVQTEERTSCARCVQVLRRLDIEEQTSPGAGLIVQPSRTVQPAYAAPAPAPVGGRYIGLSTVTLACPVCGSSLADQGDGAYLVLVDPVPAEVLLSCIRCNSVSAMPDLKVQLIMRRN